MVAWTCFGASEKLCEKFYLGNLMLNTEYFAPYGTIKLLQVIVGFFVFGLVLSDCFMGHCWLKTTADFTLRVYLTTVSAFCALCSLLIMVPHLLWPTDVVDKAKKLRVTESCYALVAVSLYFIARYYCANYYGGPGQLEGRWIPITVTVWANVVLYIIDAFLVLGVKARCGRGGPLSQSYRSAQMTTFRHKNLPAAELV